MYLVGKEYEEYQELVTELSQFTDKRTVENWNLLRDVLKEKYSRTAMSIIDASGYIKKWLKGK